MLKGYSTDIIKIHYKSLGNAFKTNIIIYKCDMVKMLQRIKNDKQECLL